MHPGQPSVLFLCCVCLVRQSTQRKGVVRQLHSGGEWSDRATDLIPTRKQNDVIERDQGQDIPLKALLVIFFLSFP